MSCNAHFNVSVLMAWHSNKGWTTRHRCTFLLQSSVSMYNSAVGTSANTIIIFSSHHSDSSRAGTARQPTAYASLSDIQEEHKEVRHYDPHGQLHRRDQAPACGRRCALEDAIAHAPCAGSRKEHRSELKGAMQEDSSL